MANIEPEMLQRLADGELDIEQTQQLLIAAEQMAANGNPSAWREIACVMVENQIFQKRFAQFAQTNSSLTSVDQNDPTGILDPVVIGNSNQSKHPQSEHAQTRTVVRPENDHSMLQHFALAAGLLISLGTGYLVGSSRTPTFSAGQSVASDTESSNKPPSVESLNQDLPQLAAGQSKKTNRISPASYVEFETPNGEAPQGQVPLYRPRDFKRLIGEDENKEMNKGMIVKLLPQSDMSDEVRGQLERSGYQLKVEVKYVSGNLGDGRKFVVPVRTMSWSPGN